MRPPRGAAETNRMRRVVRAAAALMCVGTAYLVIGPTRAGADPVSSQPIVSREFARGPVSFVVASDSSSGPLITFRNVDGFVWTKEGSLDAGWVFEKAPGIRAVAVAVDAHHGPLIAVLDQTGTVWAKEGSLDAGWVYEKSGVRSLAVASDARHGPLIAVLDQTGTAWAKEGSLDAGWVFEKGAYDPLGPNAIG
jgi:hypothetical protein